MRAKKDHHWLVFRDSITTDMRPGAASKAIVEFMDALGYQQTETSPSMIFTRGRLLANLTDPNPRHQQAEIAIDIIKNGGGDSIIEVKLRVNYFARIAFAPDLEFWQAELSGLAKALRFGYADPDVSLFAAARAYWFVLALRFGLLACFSTALLIALLLMRGL